MKKGEFVGLQISIRKSGDVTIVDLRGRSTINDGESEQFSRGLGKLVASGARKLLLNLADLTQMLQAVTHARASPVLLTVLPTALKSPTNAQVRALNEGILALGARRYVATVSL